MQLLKNDKRRQKQTTIKKKTNTTQKPKELATRISPKFYSRCCFIDLMLCQIEFIAINVNTIPYSDFPL